MRHAAGPWKHDNTWGLIISKDGSEVAACHAGSTSSKAETLANAKLIAAAPDMLSALEIVQTNLFDRCGEDLYLKAAYDAVTEAIRIARS